MRVALAAAIAAPLLCLTILFMAVVSVRGPLFFWYLFWTSPAFRIVFFSLGAAALFWLLFAVYATARSAWAMSGFTALGTLFFSVGIVCLTNGLIAQVVGLEELLTVMNNELTVLPLSLSKVLGITTHLNIDPNLPSHIAAFGLILSLIGCGMRYAHQLFGFLRGCH